MQSDAIKKKLEDYYRTVSPEQVVNEMKALGADIDDVEQVPQPSDSETREGGGICGILVICMLLWFCVGLWFIFK